jgi:hypothetical protein
MGHDSPPVAYWQLTTEGNEPLPGDAKYTSFEEVERAIAAAKRDLAEKVLAAIEGVNVADRFPIRRRGLSPQASAKSAIRRAVQRVFTESGVEVETKGGDTRDTTL